MNRTLKTFPDPATLAAGFADDFAAWTQSLDQPTITVALSGGSTPKILFQRWADPDADKIDWSRIHFFWGDERCVPPTDPESNYGVADELFFSPAKIPRENIHRVHGEAAPAEERVRYEQQIRKIVAQADNGLPQFDLVLLGMGDDGHTASIFPHESEFLNSSRICEVATHPQSQQQRITLTGPVINQAKKVVFLITGAGKANVLGEVLGKRGDFESYPASHIDADDVCFYLDEAANRQDR